MKNILWLSPLLFSFLLVKKDKPEAIYFPPPDPMVIVQPGQTYYITDTTNKNVSGLINYGRVIWDSTKSVTYNINSGGNIINYGYWRDSNPNPAIIHELVWNGINEANEIGGGGNVLSTDPGFWTQDTGQVILRGYVKKSWTNLAGSVAAGATLITVRNGTGWRVGDEIVIVPTSKPSNIVDWNDATNQTTDTFASNNFERRIIASINCNVITFTTPLKRAHLAVTSAAIGKTWTAEVLNLTRNIKIRGSDSAHRPHMLIRSGRPSNIDYTEFKWMGPRNGGGRTHRVLSRYPVHFHFCGDGSVGSTINGCSVHDIGNEGVVPHRSNGITITNNLVFNFSESAYWYDPQEAGVTSQSHDLIFMFNFAGCARYNGAQGNEPNMGFKIGQGDNNSYTYNVTVYTKIGDLNLNGGFAWNANDEGVANPFKFNLSHSEVTAWFIWQNTNLTHDIVEHEMYNCIKGGMVGAYLNSYKVNSCKFYNSPIEWHATAGFDYTTFKDCKFDAANQIPYCIEITGSPITSYFTNKLIKDTFLNYTGAGVWIGTTPDFSSDAHAKIGEIQQCIFSNSNHYVIYDPPINNNDNPKPNPPAALGHTMYEFNDHRLWGFGEGAIGEYYNGSAFNSFAFTRYDYMINFQQLSRDPGNAPDGVDHRITGDAFSIRWQGKTPPPFTGNYKFYFLAMGGLKFWINNQLIFNRIGEPRNQPQLDSTPFVSLVRGQPFQFKIEYTNFDTRKSICWFWYTDSMRYRPYAQDGTIECGFSTDPNQGQGWTFRPGRESVSQSQIYTLTQNATLAYNGNISGNDFAVNKVDRRFNATAQYWSIYNVTQSYPEPPLAKKEMYGCVDVPTKPMVAEDGTVYIKTEGEIKIYDMAGNLKGYKRKATATNTFDLDKGNYVVNGIRFRVI